MKKLTFWSVLMLMVMALPTTLFSQNHMEFRGVPINGHRDTFVSEMKKLGYTEVFRNEMGVAMKGKFTNKEANIIILASPKTQTVWKVAAQFDEDKSWSSLKSDYYYYVELYTSKYGKPSNHFEFFSDPYYEGDGFELQALKNDKCTYSSFFTIENGYITVTITKSGNISLEYEDKINSNVRTEEKDSSALDDI